MEYTQRKYDQMSYDGDSTKRTPVASLFHVSQGFRSLVRVSHFIPVVARTMKAFSFWLNVGAMCCKPLRLRRIDKEQAERHTERRRREVCQGLGLYELGQEYLSSRPIIRVAWIGYIGGAVRSGVIYNNII